jgi:DNA-binding NarL/FixJ family response regulator
MRAMGEATTVSTLPRITANHYIRTLVVDDSASTREAVCALLGLEPVIQLVGTAADGLEAVEAAASLEPELIIMDINMPRLDGFKSAAVLAKHNPNTQILLMSADDLPNLRTLGRISGAKGFIAKRDLVRGLPTALRELFPQTFRNCGSAN